jgi:hypothetical protein
MMHSVMARKPTLAKFLEGIHWTISRGRLPGFGELPITFIVSTLQTVRPPDEVIIESIEVSGMDAFEEILNLEALAKQRDPFTSA